MPVAISYSCKQGVQSDRSLSKRQSRRRGNCAIVSVCWATASLLACFAGPSDAASLFGFGFGPSKSSASNLPPSSEQRFSTVFPQSFSTLLPGAQHGPSAPHANRQHCDAGGGSSPPQQHNRMNHGGNPAPLGVSLLCGPSNPLAQCCGSCFGDRCLGGAAPEDRPMCLVEQLPAVSGRAPGIGFDDDDPGAYDEVAPGNVYAQHIEVLRPPMVRVCHYGANSNVDKKSGRGGAGAQVNNCKLLAQIPPGAGGVVRDAEGNPLVQLAPAAAADNVALEVDQRNDWSMAPQRRGEQPPPPPSPLHARPYPPTVGQQLLATLSKIIHTMTPRQKGYPPLPELVDLTSSRVLGSGSFGEVVSGVLRETGEAVAVKRYPLFDKQLTPLMQAGERGAIQRYLTWGDYVAGGTERLKLDLAREECRWAQKMQRLRDGTGLGGKSQDHVNQAGQYFVRCLAMNVGQLQVLPAAGINPNVVPDWQAKGLVDVRPLSEDLPRSLEDELYVVFEFAGGDIHSVYKRERQAAMIMEQQEYQQAAELAAAQQAAMERQKTLAGRRSKSLPAHLDLQQGPVSILAQHPQQPAQASSTHQGQQQHQHPGPAPGPRPSRILMILRQLLQAVHFLRTSVRASHHDLKLENVMFSREHNRVMIIDFGVMMPLDRNTGLPPMWTPSFAPVEMEEGSEQQARHSLDSYDIFSLANLIGQILLNGENIVGTHYMVDCSKVVNFFRCLLKQKLYFIRWQKLEQDMRYGGDIRELPYIQRHLADPNWVLRELLETASERFLNSFFTLWGLMFLPHADRMSAFETMLKMFVEKVSEEGLYQGSSWGAPAAAAAAAERARSPAGGGVEVEVEEVAVGSPQEFWGQQRRGKSDAVVMRNGIIKGPPPQPQARWGGGIGGFLCGEGL